MQEWYTEAKTGSSVVNRKWVDARAKRMTDRRELLLLAEDPQKKIKSTNNPYITHITLIRKNISFVCWEVLKKPNNPHITLIRKIFCGFLGN